MLPPVLETRRPQAACVALFLVVSGASLAVAHAQTGAAVPLPTPLAIPYGAWIASLLAGLRDLLIAAAMAAVARFVPAAIRQYLTSDVLAKAVDYAIAAVDGAVKGQTLSLPATNAVLAAAENYVVASAPGLAAELGPLLRAKILAHIASATPVASNVTAASLAAAVPATK
jgi:hypothetical protein